MHRCVRPLCMDHRCCSVPAPLSVHSCHSVSAHSERLCGCSLTTDSYVTHHAVRCVRGSLCPHVETVSCQTVGAQNTFHCLSPVAVHTTVLARRQHDGFYYLATVKQEEGHGVFLIEFNKPAGDRYLTQLQKTEADDIIPYYDALRRCIVPGDTVLAPWEPEQVRYGPGIVTLGLETRDSLRVTEDEELTVSFWNGKKTRVPLGVAVWVSPSVYRRVMDLLHQPMSSRLRVRDRNMEVTTHVCTDRFTSVPQLCHGSQPYQHRWHQHSACSLYTHRHCSCCYFPKYPTCTCCHDPKCHDWWSLTPTTTVYVQGKKEDSEDTSLRPRRTESPTRGKSPQLSTSSESEDESEESLSEDDSDQETWLSKTTLSTMVDSGVNTDSSLWDKPRVDISDRPEWKYWRRSPPEPFHRKPGANKLKSSIPKAHSGASWVDSAGSTNQSALFETIRDSPGKRLTIRDVLVHNDFSPSDVRAAPPVVERLGESEVEKLRQKKERLEKRKEKIMKHREWEEKREQNEERKYSDSQEAHRAKTLQRLKNEDVKLKDGEARLARSIKAKQEACESNGQRLQTIAAEEKQKEQRRLNHLRHVREKIDQREFEKCAANEQREIEQAEARRRRVNDHYREVAEKVVRAEEAQNGTRRAQRISAEA